MGGDRAKGQRRKERMLKVAKGSEPPRKYVGFRFSRVFSGRVACGSGSHPAERYGMNGNIIVITSTTALFACQGKKAKGR